MIRAVLIMILWSGVAFGWTVKTARHHEDRATYVHWSNLIHGVNLRCEPTWYGTNGVPPFTDYSGVYMVWPTNHTATWPVGSYLGITNRVVITNAGGEEIRVTNHVLASIPVIFTNMVGRLDDLAIDAWLETNQWLELVDIPAPLTVTNVAMTARNVYELDQKIRSLIPYYVDMAQIEAAGGFATYFATARPGWTWTCVSGCVDGGGQYQWVATNEYPMTLPFMTLSNAFRYAGITSYYHAVIWTSAVATAELVPGWTVGAWNSYTVTNLIPAGSRINGHWEYLFALAPVVTNYAAQLASMSLLTTNEATSTNTWVDENGVTNQWTETAVDLGWMIDPYVYSESDRAEIARYGIDRTNIQVQAVLQPVSTGLIDVVSLVISGPVFSVASSGVGYVSQVMVSSNTPTLPFARVTSIAATNWQMRQIFRYGSIPPPGWTNPVPAEGSRVIVAMTGTYYRFKRHVAPGLQGYGQPTDVREINPFADTLMWRERWAVLTNLTTSAVHFDYLHFWRTNTAEAIPYRAMPEWNTGYINARTLGARNYNTIGGRNEDDVSFSCEITSGSEQAPFDSCSNRAFVGFSFTLAETGETPLEIMVNNPVGFSFDDLEWTYYTDAYSGISKSGSETRFTSGFENEFPYDPWSVSTWFSYHRKGRDPGIPIIRWPDPFELNLGVSKEVSCRGEVYVHVTNFQSTNSELSLGGAQLATHEVDGGSFCIEIAITNRPAYALAPHPVEALFAPHYLAAGASDASSGFMTFQIDVNDGIRPDADWYTTVVVPFTCDGSGSGHWTNFSGQIGTSTWTDHKEIINYHYVPRFRDITRRLDGVWVTLSWDFPTLIIPSL